MNRLSVELKVGLLILSGMLITVYASVAVTGWRPGQGDTYTLFANVENASGLLPGSPVQVAGVRVGKVDDISLDGNEARMRLNLFSRYVTYSDAEISIRSLGILGDKYVNLNLGSKSATPLPPGGEISLIGPNTGLENLVSSISNIVSDVSNVTSALQDSFGSKRGRKRLEAVMENISFATENIHNITKVTNQQIEYILFNLREFTDNVNRISKDNEDDIRRLVKGFATFGEQLANISSANRKEIDSIIQNVEIFSGALAENGPSIIRDLRLLLTNNRQKIAETVDNINNAFIHLEDAMVHVESISAKLDEGEGTFGRLINDDTTVNNLDSALSGASNFFGSTGRLKLDVGGHVEYLTQAGSYKSFIDLRLRPLKDRFYEIQLVKDPRGSKRKKTTYTTENEVTTKKEEETTTEDMELSISIGQRYYDTIIQGGLIENSFGINLQQLFGRRDQFSLGTSIWDLERDEGAHLKLYGIWRALSNTFLIAGQDDVINNQPDQVNPFVGVGIHFNEDSLRPLVGTIGGLGQ